jgi:hypothetical protein
MSAFTPRITLRPFTRVFRAIAALLQDVELDGSNTARGWQAKVDTLREGFVTQEQQSLLVKLIPQNPMLPAISHGARGLMTITDFVTQREVRTHWVSM